MTRKPTPKTPSGLSVFLGLVFGFILFNGGAMLICGAIIIKFFSLLAIAIPLAILGTFLFVKETIRIFKNTYESTPTLRIYMIIAAVILWLITTILLIHGY